MGFSEFSRGFLLVFKILEWFHGSHEASDAFGACGLLPCSTLETAGIGLKAPRKQRRLAMRDPTGSLWFVAVS